MAAIRTVIRPPASADVFVPILSFLFLLSAMMQEACLFLFFLLFAPLCFGSFFPFFPLPNLDPCKGEVVRR